MCEPEFRGAELLRLGPYSAPLNPIEEVWSVLKAELERRLAVAMPTLLEAAPEQDMAMTERRLRHLEAAIDSSVPVVTPRLCMSTCNHVQRHFAACLALTELAMDDNER